MFSPKNLYSKALNIDLKPVLMVGPEIEKKTENQPPVESEVCKILTKTP